MAQLFRRIEIVKRLFLCPLWPVPAALLLASCATLRIDGDAVACSKCRAMWIYLFAASPAPGFYCHDEPGDKRRPCPRCQELAVRFFETRALPERCPDCGGSLQMRTVQVTRGTFRREKNAPPVLSGRAPSAVTCN